MEAVAAAASIAGIITVVGQSIDGLIRLSDFFSDLSSASKTINRLLDDINSLVQVLRNIGDVLEQAEARRPDQNFASLDVKVEDCAKDVRIWLATARVLDPASNGGGKAWLKKFRLAVNNTAIQTIREEIGRHRQTLCLSLAVFGRTIDIDTSDQVHQIGGRFDEALSTSLSIHSAHVEALRRIEHYSMTSMHSSAHSIRSMDSIHTELSRLEAMITSASGTHQSKIEIASRHTRRGSDCTERRSFAVEKGDEWNSNLSISGPRPKHNGGSSTAQDSGIGIAPRQNSHDGTRRNIDHSSQSQRTSEIAIEHCGQPNYYIPSADYRSSLDESDDVNNRPMDTAAEGENKSSFLYAEFSKRAEPRQHESPGFEIDCGAIHSILRQSLASIYPPEVVDYVSIRQVTTLCEDHIDLLDIRPDVQISSIELSYVDHGTPASAPQPMINLRNRLVELRNAIKLSREQCKQAGYSLSELDKLLFPPGSRSYAPADGPPLMPGTDGGDDSSSVYSEDFHSTTE